MATGEIRAGIGITNPHPRQYIYARARARARHPPRAALCARTRYPRACFACGHARIAARSINSDLPSFFSPKNHLYASSYCKNTNDSQDISI